MTDTDRLADIERKLDSLIERADRAEQAFAKFLAGPFAKMLVKKWGAK